MNVGSMVFKGGAAALVLIAGGIGCSSSKGDHRISKSERRASKADQAYATNSRSGDSQSRPHSGSTSVAEAPPLTYGNQPAAGQPVTYSTHDPVGANTHQDVVATATATNAPPAYYASPVARQDSTYPTNASIAAAQRQREAVTITAPEAPPATRPEMATHSRSNDEFWVNGYWRWDSRTFSWQPGHVERLRQSELYHPATWIKSAQGWDFTPAYWQ